MRTLDVARVSPASILLLCFALVPSIASADAIVLNEYNALGVAPANLIQTIAIPSGCANPLPQTASCGPDPFTANTADGIFSVTMASDTVTNLLGLFQLLMASINVTDNTGANGILTLDVNQTYLFSGVATSYTAFDFMSGSFGGPAGAGLPNGNTSVQTTLGIDSSVVLPVLSATAADADAAAFNRGPGFAVFPTPPLAGVTFDGLAQFNFLSANQIAGDSIDLPFGLSDAPESSTIGLFAVGGLVLIFCGRSRRRAG